MPYSRKLRGRSFHKICGLRATRKSFPWNLGTSHPPLRLIWHFAKFFSAKCLIPTDLRNFSPANVSRYYGIMPEAMGLQSAQIIDYQHANYLSSLGPELFGWQSSRWCPDAPYYSQSLGTWMTKRGFHQEAGRRQNPTEYMHNSIV